MTDFLRLDLGDNTEVLFQSAGSDFVNDHGGAPDVSTVTGALAQLQSLANATNALSQTFRERVAPDEIQLEIGIGLSGEVGWFFAKSALETSLKLTLTWKSDPPS